MISRIYFKDVRIGQRFTLKGKEDICLKIDYDNFMKFGTNEVFRWNSQSSGVINEIMGLPSGYGRSVGRFCVRRNKVTRTTESIQ